MNNTQKIKSINHFLVENGLNLSVKKAPKSLNKSALKFDYAIVFSGSNAKHELEKIYQMRSSSFINESGTKENSLLNALNNKNFI